MDQMKQLPDRETRFKVVRLVDIVGTFPQEEYLPNRQKGAVVRYHGPVPGYGDRVWWCRNPSGDFAPYAQAELEPHIERENKHSNVTS